jgi:GNAT superfamily N-acetyltransferase
MKSSAEDVVIQEFDPTHYQGVLEVYNTLFPEHKESLEELRHFDENWDYKRYDKQRYVALTSEGVVVGVGEWGHSPSVFHPRKFWVDVDVHPDWQRRGIGTRLWDHLFNVLKERGAVELRSSARESMPECVRFLEKRGYVEKMRAWESVLDLTKFDPTPFRRYVEGLDEVDVTTLAQEEATNPNLYEDLHRLQETLMEDVPMPGRHTPISMDQFMGWMKGPDRIPEAYFLAKAGSEYVGQCTLDRKMEIEGALTHGLTGVLREYRGRGVAMALKVLALEWAKDAGYKSVRTWNDTTNEAMLAINEKMGFKREPAWITFIKELGGQDDE